VKGLTVYAVFTIATALQLRQESNMLIFCMKLTHCCKVLQPIAMPEAVKMGAIFSFNIVNQVSQFFPARYAGTV